MTIFQLWDPTVQFQARNGANLVNGSITITYKDRTELAPIYDFDGKAIQNPVYLDENGRASVYAEIGKLYTLHVKDQNGALVYTQDVRQYPNGEVTITVPTIVSSDSITATQTDYQYSLDVNSDYIKSIVGSGAFIAYYGQTTIDELDALDQDTIIYALQGSMVLFPCTFRANGKYRFANTEQDQAHELTLTSSGWSEARYPFGSDSNIHSITYGDSIDLSDLTKYDTVLMSMNSKTFYLTELTTSKATFSSSYAINGTVYVETVTYDGTTWSEVQVSNLGGDNTVLAYGETPTQTFAELCALAKDGRLYFGGNIPGISSYPGNVFALPVQLCTDDSNLFATWIGGAHSYGVTLNSDLIWSTASHTTLLTEADKSSLETEISSAKSEAMAYTNEIKKDVSNTVITYGSTPTLNFGELFPKFQQGTLYCFDPTIGGTPVYLPCVAYSNGKLVFSVLFGNTEYNVYLTPALEWSKGSTDLATGKVASQSGQTPDYLGNVLQAGDNITLETDGAWVRINSSAGGGSSTPEVYQSVLYANESPSASNTYALSKSALEFDYLLIDWVDVDGNARRDQMNISSLTKVSSTTSKQALSSNNFTVFVPDTSVGLGWFKWFRWYLTDTDGTTLAHSGCEYAMSSAGAISNQSTWSGSSTTVNSPKVYRITGIVLKKTNYTESNEAGVDLAITKSTIEVVE